MRSGAGKPEGGDAASAGVVPASPQRRRTKPIAIQRCSRFHTLGLLRVNFATFPEKRPKRPPGFYLARDMWSLQRRLGRNFIFVATRGFAVLGSVEIYSTEYLRRTVSGLTDEEQAKLQPYPGRNV